MSNYPFIERLGLRVFKHFNYGWSYSEPNSAGGCGSSSDGPRNVVYADELEKLLSSAQAVTGFKDEEGEWTWGDYPCEEYDTHSTLVVGFQPIRKESAEDLLREFVKEYGESGGTSILRNISARARKLLEGK